MAEIVNLRQARKQRARAEKDKAAEQNPPALKAIFPIEGSTDTVTDVAAPGLRQVDRRHHLCDRRRHASVAAKDTSRTATRRPLTGEIGQRIDPAHGVDAGVGVPRAVVGLRLVAIAERPVLSGFQEGDQGVVVSRHSWIAPRVTKLTPAAWPGETPPNAAPLRWGGLPPQLIAFSPA